jgi:hypothetical protein
MSGPTLLQTQSLIKEIYFSFWHRKFHHLTVILFISNFQDLNWGGPLEMLDMAP